MRERGVGESAIYGGDSAGWERLEVWGEVSGMAGVNGGKDDAF